MDLLANDAPSLNAFVKDTSLFLLQPDAALFAYNVECTKPFFDLVSKRRLEISAASIKVFEKAMEEVQWIRRDVLKQPTKAFTNTIRIDS